MKPDNFATIDRTPTDVAPLTIESVRAALERMRELGQPLDPRVAIYVRSDAWDEFEAEIAKHCTVQMRTDSHEAAIARIEGVPVYKVPYLFKKWQLGEAPAFPYIPFPPNRGSRRRRDK